MDDPESTQQGLRQAYQSLLDSDLGFDRLLLAHGHPVAPGGRRALEAFLAEG